MANTNKKPTIVENFNTIKDILETNGLLTDELAEFIDKRIAVTEKKNASGGGEKKLSKEQEQNEVYKAEILASMEVGKSYTISDMMKNFAVCENFPSPNKANALVKQLKDSGKVIRTEVKGKAYFTLA